MTNKRVDNQMWLYFSRLSTPFSNYTKPVSSIHTLPLMGSWITAAATQTKRAGFSPSLVPSAYPASSWGRPPVNLTRMTFSPDTCPTSSGSLWCSAPLPSPSCMTKLLTIFLRDHTSCGGNSFRTLVSLISSCGHYSWLVTIGGGRNIDRLVNEELSIGWSW